MLREGKRPKPVVLPYRMWSSTTACPRWRTSRNWADPPRRRGVGEKHLMPQALVLVEQGQQDAILVGLRCPAGPRCFHVTARSALTHVGAQGSARGAAGLFNALRLIASAATRC